MDGLVSEFRGPPLAHGGLRAVRRAFVLEPERLEAEETRGFDLRIEIGERMRYALEGGKWLPERLALGHVAPGLFERDARDGEHLESDEGAREVEALHHLDEALVLIAETVRGGNTDVLEEQRAAADRALAVTVEAIAGDPGQIHRDEQGRDAMRPGLDRSSPTEHHRRVRLVGRGDRGLLAVDDIVIAVALDAEAKIGGVRSAARFGECYGEQGLAGRQALEPRLRDLRIAVMREYLPVQRGQQVDIRNAEVGARDFLVDHAGGETTQPQAAELFGQLGSDEAHRAHLLHDPAVEDARPIAL